jgi:hypothetical protein
MLRGDLSSISDRSVTLSTAIELLRAEDVDVPMVYPDGLERVLQQRLVDLTPWHMMDREAAKQRLNGLRGRYKAKVRAFRSEAGQRRHRVN